MITLSLIIITILLLQLLIIDTFYPPKETRVSYAAILLPCVGVGNGGDRMVAIDEGVPHRPPSIYSQIR